MLKLGNTLIENVKRGSTQIAKVYRGTVKIWENWVAKINGYAITYGFQVSGNQYSAISPTGVKVRTVSWSIGAYNGNDYGFGTTSSLYGKRQLDGAWEVCATFSWSIGPVESKVSTGTTSVVSGKEETIYTQFYVSPTNRSSTIQLATYLEKG